ncbi:hypothetical protein N5079_13950 [Planotetraspora sp. A-T 1434]|uniref:hypothetical protein n=1 Tax=Planotetraspora sp. A-T 1434 TaxID=2979219 RepID=UPI0021C161A6|nr:hypothetical protein [Planotetraspora sp. A-T 1434]MCT9931321.1 hypothetical protein [Planotetraspora sp. A-T 1434]
MRPHEETLVLRDPYRIAGLWVRVALLVVLLWGGLITVLSAAPLERSAADFQTALRAGQVTYVIYKGTGNCLDDLRWSSGPLFWYQAKELWNLTYTRRDLSHDLSAAGPGPVVRRVSRHDDGKGLFLDWPFQVPVPRLSWLVKAAWIATLVIMLGTARPRLGNRWAWFWLFTVGEIGAIAFLFFEPRPIWCGPGPQGPAYVGRMGGGQGCLIAICFNLMASALAAVGILDVVRTIIGGSG